MCMLFPQLPKCSLPSPPKLDLINNEKVTEEANQRTWTLSTVL